MRGKKMSSKCLKYQLLSALTIISISLAGCSASRKVIKDTEINNNADYGIEYSDDYYLDKNKAQTKIFDIGEHVITIKTQGAIGYDQPIRFIAPDGYKIIGVSYNENASGEYGFEYGFIFTTFVNDVPVEVTGYYDELLQDYTYTSFGKQIKSKETEESVKSLTK
jgi:hypothetical protein